MSDLLLQIPVAATAAGDRGNSAAAAGAAATDESLMRRIGGGDALAFGKFHDRYARQMWGVVARILGSTSEAEDSVQEAFVAIWTDAPDYRPERGRPFTWAVAIVRHNAIDRLRRSSRHLERIEREFRQRSEAAAAEPADRSLLRSESHVTVRSAVAALECDEQRAIELAFFNGLTQVEIATVLSVPLGTIKARIRRGLLKLRGSAILADFQS